MSMRLATMSMMVRRFLAAMDLNGLRQCGASAVMRVPSFCGIARVEDQHRNILLHRGQDGGGVQHLGAEVGELGCLFEADGADAERVGADARIGGHDAVHVGPDLDGLRRAGRRRRARR